MRHIINIDWLQLFCIAELGHFGGVTEFFHYHWEYKLHDYGTSAYREVYTVKIGKTIVCTVQCEPRNGLMEYNTVVVKFDNRLLYRRDKWDIIHSFLDNHYLRVHNISRLDLCADFQDFCTTTPPKLILNFLQSKWRHKGKGAGNAYFVHYNKQVQSGKTMQHLAYNGLSFGSRESDCRVYLYNKSLELHTVKDKPYIRDQWRSIGLDPARNVWRLEVSMKSDAMKLYNKSTKDKIKVEFSNLKDYNYIKQLYYALIRKYFSFVKNDHAISNISREPTIKLFEEVDGAEEIGILREKGCSNSADKVFIKRLYQAANKYDYLDLDEDLLKALSEKIATGVDLFVWKLRKEPEWNEEFETTDRIKQNASKPNTSKEKVELWDL